MMPFAGRSKLPLEVIIYGIVPYCNYNTARNISTAFFVNPNESDYFVGHTNLECDFVVNFKRKLMGFGVEYPDKFIDVLKKYSAIISGSFVLNTILGCDWESGDIDVYTINSGPRIAPIIKDIMVSSGADEAKIDDRTVDYNDIDRVFTTKISVMEFVMGENAIEIGSVYTIICTNSNMQQIKIQLITLNGLSKEDIYTYINSSFDFGFCKNTFDGDSLIVMDRKSVIMKKCYIGNCDKPKIKFERIIKYTRRGMKIEGLEQYYNKQLSHDAIKHLHSMKLDYSYKYGNGYDWYRELNENQGFIFISNSILRHFLEFAFVSLGFGNLTIQRTSTFGKSDKKLIEIINIAKKKFCADSFETINNDGCNLQFFGRKYNVIELIISERMFIQDFDSKFIELMKIIIHEIDDGGIIHMALYEWASDMIQTIDTKMAIRRIKKYKDYELV